MPSRGPGAGPEPDLFTIPLDWRRWWTIVPEIVTLVCTALLPLVVGANVLSRHTDWYRIPWAEDVVKLLFLWIVFLGGAVAVKYEAHVRMSILTDRLARGGRAGAAWIRVLRWSPLAVGVVLLVLGVRIVEISMHREMPSLEVSVGYFNAVIPLSGALIIVYVLRALRRARDHGPGRPG